MPSDWVASKPGGHITRLSILSTLNNGQNQLPGTTKSFTFQRGLYVERYSALLPADFINAGIL